MMRLKREQTVYQLTFMPTMFPVNCYFVQEEEGLTLIDAALPYSAKGIRQAAEHIGKPIMRIALTHAHEDHLGALDALKRALPHVPVCISARDSRLLAGDKALLPGEPDTPIRGGAPKALKTRADILLRDGDRVGSLLAVAVPGHTPGSMAFFDTRNRALIAGDAFQLRGGIAVAGQVRPLFPFPAMGTWNKAASLASAHTLLGLQPSLLAVGHGNLLVHPASLMERAIAEAERNLARTAEHNER